MTKNVKSFGKVVSPGKIGIFHSKSYMPYSHYHLEYELFFLTEGTGIFGVGNNIIPISAGDTILVEPKKEHYFTKTSEGFTYIAFIFDTSVFGAEDDPVYSTIQQIKIRNDLRLPDSILEKMKEAVTLESDNVFGSEFHTKSLIFEIFSHILNSNQFVKITENSFFLQPQMQAIKDVCLYIENHCSEKIDYLKLLEQTNYSKSQFLKVFKKQTGMTITDYILKCRIEKSCLDFLNSEKNITEIAVGNGFNNVQYFSKKFKEFMGCTPREFKKNAYDIMIPTANNQTVNL